MVKTVLVITRKAGEGVYVGEDIFVKVLSIRGTQVRFGFDAPRSVIILREEMRNGDKRKDEAAVDKVDTNEDVY